MNYKKEITRGIEKIIDERSSFPPCYNYLTGEEK